MLTNKMDGKFTISELEVWEVTGYMDEKDHFVKYDLEEANRIREEKLDIFKKKKKKCKSVKTLHLITHYVYIKFSYT